MTKRPVHFFENPGEENTAAVIRAVACVTGPPSWKKLEYKFPLIAEKERKMLRTLGIPVINDIDEPFKPITFRNWWEKKTVRLERPAADLFWMTLIGGGGHGLRTAVEVVFMAVEAETIKIGERVIGVAGTGSGADAALVMRASRFEDAVGPDPRQAAQAVRVRAAAAAGPRPVRGPVKPAHAVSGVSSKKGLLT